MKKLLLILSLFAAFNMQAMAFLTPEEATSEAYIQQHGHSDEMSRLIDLQNAQINGARPTYKGKDPDWYESNKAVKFVRKVFMYFDGGLDDGKFMQNNCNPSTRWDNL